MKAEISQDFLTIILNLVRIQNEQLLKIICENEELDFDELQDILPSAYDLKAQVRLITLTNQTNQTLQTQSLSPTQR